jgi:threonylcarbamoyladenosine tRNA methylthiotransferase MtaB
MARIAFHTFGCRLNQAETATLSASFAHNGHEVVDLQDPNDIVVVNTCTVTENGDADTRRMVRRIVRANPDAEIALVGCQAQMQPQFLAALPNVRWVVGNADKMDLVSIIADDSCTAETTVLRNTPPRRSFTMPVDGIDPFHTRANLKIQDGCDFFCSFCVIPYARGRARSREFPDLIREARNLSAAGYRELVLTGVNIGTYQYEAHGFMDVIAELLATPGLDRLRISSIEPTTIPEALLPEIQAQPQLCPYLHIPLQSGSDSMLESMNRRYTPAEFADYMRQAFAEIADLCFGTDIIVGYPGETKAHFDDSVAFVESLPFSYFHVFSYSDRDRAKSRNFADHVPKGEIRRRSRVLRALSERKRETFMSQYLGATREVLIEQQKDGVWTGLTDNFIRVRLSADCELRNEIVPVRLTAVDGAAMQGELI